MKKVLVFVGLCILWSTTTFAQTYYYERTAIIKNGEKQTSSGDGQFISFNSHGCYNSDNKGWDEGLGFRKYKGLKNDIITFYGENHYGENAHYYFSADYSRLNIKLDSNGVIYVYKRLEFPQGVTHSFRWQVKNSPPIAPIIDIPIDPSPNPSIPSSSQCRGCNGTGHCTMCKGKGWYKNSYSGNLDNCSSCRGSGRCGVCYGKGSIY